MQLSRLLFCIALLVFPVALLGTTWLYLYPVFQGCAFPSPPSTHAQAVAPFRLLALGDPQLEGDSSLPDPDALIFPSVEFLVPHLRNATTLQEGRGIVGQAAKGVMQDAGRWLEGKRKAVDLWGNDWYLAHIVRSMTWWTEPTHISVLGDLLGSQWVTDGEFRKRAGRYWHVVMKGLEKVPDRIFGAEEVKTEEAPAEPAENGEAEEEDNNKAERKRLWGGTTEVLGEDKSWEKRVINIAGNHDVGYAGDLDESRIERFERAFGSVNWDIWFTLPDHLRSNYSTSPSSADVAQPDTPPVLRLVILNSMNLDTPAWSADLQTETYQYLNHIITNSLPVEDKTHATILLTHIPLEKEPGVCVDAPYFDFFEDGQGVKEQNMLSGHASKIVLEGLFGMSGKSDAAGAGLGRRGVVVNGHDHAGCHVVHFVPREGGEGACDVNAVERGDAYWPALKANESMPEAVVGMNSEDLNAMALVNDTDSDSDSPSEPQSTPNPPPSPGWKARAFPHRSFDISPDLVCTSINKSPHIREITLRSMMGEYSGYAGFLSAWFDDDLGEKGEWVFEFGSCGVGVQHWWWCIHIIDLIVVVALLGGGLAYAYERVVLGGERLERRVGKKGGVEVKRGVQSGTSGN
ncbi:hypothetical protein EJ02DRAFT_102070 [Clathrospora elynae]|uniref:Calcineurin-like phosphoesterase domain-containing protein n=1 Tax=Clathrospora elynae TaxID=706981 RepID=A0A6A5SCC1_9PLEO|nr:hypothetical protein EJ02DRAFT_102070 [Clathrospora elynae]